MVFESKRPTSAQRGYSYKWQQYRLGYLSKHPYCVKCNRIASVVDHVTPPRIKEALSSGDQDRIAIAKQLFWDKSNHQSLCTTCHSSGKQRLEKSGKVAGCDASGRPIDPNHHWNRA